MKLYTLLFVACFFLACQNKKSPGINKTSITDTSYVSNPTSIQFKDTLVNLGVIKEGEIKKLSYEFINSGQNDLLILDTRPGCGCTVADYPKEPIKTGKGGIINAEFNSTKKLGKHKKSIVVFSNTLPPETRLFFEVEVIQ